MCQNLYQNHKSWTWTIVAKVIDKDVMEIVEDVGGDNFQNTLFMCLKLSACKTDKAVISSNTYMKSS